MKCSVCGAEIQKTDKYCGICGALNAERANAEQAAPAETGREQAFTGENSAVKAAAGFACEQNPAVNPGASCEGAKFEPAVEKESSEEIAGKETAYAYGANAGFKKDEAPVVSMNAAPSVQNSAVPDVQKNEAPAAQKQETPAAQNGNPPFAQKQEASAAQNGNPSFVQRNEASAASKKKASRIARSKEKKTCSLWVAVLCAVLIFILSVTAGTFAGLYFSGRTAASAGVSRYIEQVR